MEELAQMESIHTLVLAHLVSLTATAILPSTIVPLNPARMEEPAQMELTSTPAHVHSVILAAIVVPSSTTAAHNLVQMVEPVLMALAASRVNVPQRMKELTAQHVRCLEYLVII